MQSRHQKHQQSPFAPPLSGDEAYQRHLAGLPELFPKGLPAEPSRNPHALALEKAMAKAPNLAISQERQGTIDAWRARQTALFEYLGQRRTIISGAGFDCDLVGIEFFEFVHKACGTPLLVPVAAGIPQVLCCPYCRPSMGGR